MSAVGRSRVRVAHSKTVKNGWQHETSVEFEWTEVTLQDNATAHDRLRWLMELADSLGREESERRTALDAGEAES